MLRLVSGGQDCQVALWDFCTASEDSMLLRCETQGLKFCVMDTVENLLLLLLRHSCMIVTASECKVSSEGYAVLSCVRRLGLFRIASDHLDSQAPALRSGSGRLAERLSDAPAFRVQFAADEAMLQCVLLPGLGRMPERGLCCTGSGSWWASTLLCIPAPSFMTDASCNVPCSTMNSNTYLC